MIALVQALREMGYILSRRRFRIGCATLLAGFVAYTWSSATGASYTATARILLAGTAQPASAQALNVQAPGQAARDEAEILRDPALVMALMPVLRPRLPPPPGFPASLLRGLAAWWHETAVKTGSAVPQTADQALAAKIGRALVVQAVPGTDVVTLRMAWSSPDFAALVLNALLDNQRRLAQSSAAGSQEVLMAQTRLQAARAQLSGIEAQIAGLPGGAAAADPGPLEQEKDRLAARIAGARAADDQLRLDRDTAARKLEAAEKAYAGGAWVDNPDAATSAAGAATVDPVFVELLDKRQKLLEKLPPDHPRVKAVDGQIAAARAQAYQSARQVLNARLKAIDGRLAAAEQQIAADDEAGRALDDRLVGLRALLASRRAAETGVADAERRADEAKRAAESMRDSAGLHVMSPATVPAEADFPQPALIVAGGALVGFLLGFASGWLAERTRGTIERPEDVETLLGLTVLARVPELR